MTKNMKVLMKNLPVMIPRAVAPDQMMARLSGTQPELTGITKSLKMAILKIDAKKYIFKLEK